MSEDFGECLVTGCTCGVSGFAVALAESVKAIAMKTDDWICPDPDCDCHERRTAGKNKEGDYVRRS